MPHAAPELQLLSAENLRIVKAGTVISENISLSTGKGECLCIIGSSGCGKTTLLQALLGLEAPDSGRIQRRTARLASFFQTPRLLPWRTAQENLTILPGVSTETAEHLLTELGFSRQDRQKYPAELSGGMQQRAALARALAAAPELLFMDEPFSALDWQLRSQLQTAMTARIQTGLAAILVTHDREEALRMATAIIRLSGRPAHITARLDLPDYAVRTETFIKNHLEHPIFAGIDT